jgi:predicted methyltransferase
MLDRLRRMAEDRPSVDVTLDQSHATPETALRRALYLRECDVLGRDLLLLGDDDLTSLAIGLLRGHVRASGRLAVAEVDPRLVDFLVRISGAEGFGIEARLHDLRDPLPEPLAETFDAFLTDPPYTPDGLRLFLSRGIRALRPGGGRQVFVCFGPKSPDEQLGVLRAIGGLGLAITEMHPTFNRYIGAQMLGGVSAMIRAVSAGEPPISDSRYDGPIYTADRKREM